jgi:hypothetical protein
MGGTSGGQNYWELVDVSTGEVLLRSWDKEDVVRLYEKCAGHHSDARGETNPVDMNGNVPQR